MKKELHVRGRDAETIMLANVPALRIAFVVASIMILTGVILSHFVHPYWIVLVVLVAGGLLFSGLVGWCPMALIVQKLLPSQHKETVRDIV